MTTVQDSSVFPRSITLPQVGPRDGRECRFYFFYKRMVSLLVTSFGLGFSSGSPIGRLVRIFLLIVNVSSPQTGWHYSVWRYKTRIYMQVRRMIDLLQHILPVNQRIIDDYLSHWTFGEYEMLLRSATSFNQNERLDPHLMKLVDWFEKTEEERLRNNMKSVDYEIDSAETVVLVTGLGRIERVSPSPFLLQHYVENKAVPLPTSLPITGARLADRDVGLQPQLGLHRV